MAGDVVGRVPEADRQPGEVRGAERRRLGHLRPHDRHAEQVGLKLHQQLLAGGAAVDAQLRQIDSRVGLHRFEQVGDLEGDALERGAGDVAGGRAAREPDDRAARVGIPVRRAQAGERGHEVDAAAVGHRRRQRLDLGRLRDDAEPVAQPLDHRAADEDAAFERVLGLAADLPGDRREQPVA